MRAFRPALLAGVVVLALGGCWPFPTAVLQSRLRADLSGAVGVALTTEMYESPADGIPRAYANLWSIEPDGTMAPAVIDGTIKSQYVLLASNGRLYINNDGLTLTNGSQILEIDPATGRGSILGLAANWGAAMSAGPVQALPNGDVVYWSWDTGRKRVLIRASSGTISKLASLNEDPWTGDFLAVPDGSVLYVLTDVSSAVLGLERVASDGTAQEVFGAGFASSVDSMVVFPDGEPYVGLTLISGTSGLYHVNADGTLAAAPLVADRFCAGAVVTTSGKVFGNEGYAGIYQYYPSLAPATTSLSPSFLWPAGDKVLISGNDAAQRGTLSLYDPGTDSETDLLPTHDLWVQHAGYSAAANSVSFLAQGSDNAWYEGRVDLSSGNAVTIVPLGAGVEVRDAAFFP